MSASPHARPTTAPLASGAFPRARTIGRIRGVPVRIDASCLLLVGIVGFLYWQRLEFELAAQSTGLAVVLTLVAVVLFVASIVVHELGHAVTSQDRGIPVIAITMFGLGGVTESTREADRARHELVIVAAGPFMSLVCASAFALGYRLVEDVTPLALVFGYLAWTNLALAVFNLLPAYPLDGGRLLRGLLWGVTGRRYASTRWAARVGQAFSVSLALLGLWIITRADGLNQLAFEGVWLGLVALFMFRGAADAHRRARAREVLAARSAGDEMGDVPPALDPATTVDDAAAAMAQRPSLLWPVGSPVIGGVHLPDLDVVPPDRRAVTTLADIAHREVTVAPDAPMDEVLERMVRGPGQMVIVVGDDGRPLGLLTPSLVLPLVR